MGEVKDPGWTKEMSGRVPPAVEQGESGGQIDGCPIAGWCQACRWSSGVREAGTGDQEAQIWLAQMSSGSGRVQIGSGMYLPVEG